MSTHQAPEIRDNEHDELADLIVRECRVTGDGGRARSVGVLARALRLGVVIVDGAVVVCCNEAAARVLGVRVGQTLSPVRHVFLDGAGEVISHEQNLLGALLARRELRSESFKYRRSPDELISIEATIRVIDPEETLLVFESVTTARPFGLVMSREDHVLHTFIRQSPLAVAMFDRQMCCIACSERWLAHHQISSDEITGRSFYEVFPETEENVRIEHQRTLAGQTRGENEDPVLRADGSVDYVFWRNLPWYDERGEIGGVIMLSLLVTEQVSARKELERRNRELSRLNLELEQLAFMASHDLRAPLRAIRQLAEWLIEDLDEHLYEEAAQKVGMLLSRADRLERLQSDLLDFLRIDRVSPPPARISLRECVEEIWRMLDPDAGFELVVDAPDDELLLEHVPLRQVFQNLIDNALMHHDKPRGVIEVSVAFDSEHRMVCRVCDDGPGIPASARALAFRPFQTLGASGATSVSSGLGMALVKRLVERRDGQVWLEDSRHDTGLCVVFSWPVL